MKVARRTAQAFASMVLLSLLMSGSVFAYSTHFSQLSSSASPLVADDKSSTTTSAGSTVSTEHENTQVSNTHTSENDGEHTLQFKLVPATTAAVGKGNAELASKYWRHAQELNPDDWNYHRQEWSFTPQEASKKWREKFDRLERPYYPKLDMTTPKQ